MVSRGSSAQRALVPLVSTMLALFVLFPSIVFPYFEDTALVAAVARWRLEGLRLYLDVFDHKLPALYWEAAARIALFGRSALALRAHEALGLVLAGHAAGALSARTLPRSHETSARMLGVVLTAALGSTAVWRLAERGQTEMLQIGWVLGAAWLAARAADPERRGAEWLAFASGAALAWAGWMKPQVLVLAPALAVALAVAPARTGRARWGPVFALATGAAALSVLVTGVLAWTGEIEGLRELLFEHQPSYLGSARASWIDLAITLLEDTLSPRFVLLVAIACGGAAIVAAAARREASARPTAIVAAGLLAYGAVAFLSSGYGFAYHSLTFVPALAVLTTIGVARAAGALVERARPALVVALTSLLIGLFVANPAWRTDADAALAIVTGVRSLEQTWAVVGRELHYYRYTTELAAAREVDARVREGGSFFVAGLSAVTYLEARTRPACRQLVTIFAHMPGYGRAQVVRDEIAACLEREQPEVLLVRTSDVWPWFGVPTSSAVRFAQDPVLAPILERSYRVIGRIDEETLFLERCPSAACSAAR